ncbi:MAG: DUF5666 domain-containing protein, partial [candidate division KSB1 bacterium]|nr:DUF5666 domain-containing protein [candidate division KSB1 bacterium]
MKGSLTALYKTAMVSVAMTVFFWNFGVRQADAQGRNSLTFSSVKVGQWVKIDGAPQRDGTVLAEEVKILTGDFQDDDWEVSGKISRVDRGRKSVYILGLRVRTNEETEYEASDEKTRAS